LEDETKILDDQRLQHPIQKLEKVIDAESILNMQETIKEVYIAAPIKKYIITLIRKTREHQDVYLGSSPRGSLALYRSSQARAALEGRTYVIPDDVKALAEVILSHRIILAPSARLRDLSPEDVIKDIVEEVAVPGGDPLRWQE
jgi:MoxR-like ATPase